MELYNQVNEYMTAFLNAPRQKTENEGLTGDTRTILLFNYCELAASRFSDNRMEFITWRLDKNGFRNNGNYYNDFTQAKQCFAVRAELVDRDMMFTEKQLAVIRSNLSDYLALATAPLTRKQEESIEEVINKIDDVIVPEIQEKAEEEEELGYEPEREI
jgi:hypothetical protein